MIASLATVFRRSGVCGLRQVSFRSFTTQSMKLLTIKHVRSFSGSTSAPNSSDNNDFPLSTEQRFDLKLRRRELLTQLDKESTSLIDNEMAKDLTDYVKDQKFRLACDADGHVVMKKTVDNYSITVQFDIDINEELQREMNQREMMNEHENQEDKENNNSLDESQRENESDEDNEENEEEFRAPWASFDVDVRISEGKKSTSANNDKIPKFMRISCLATSKGELEIRGVCFDDRIAESPSADIPEINAEQKQLDEMMEFGMREQEAMQKTIDTDDISDATYEQLVYFLNSIGIDEKFPQFVQGYSDMIRNKKLQEKLGMFKRFLLQ